MVWPTLGSRTAKEQKGTWPNLREDKLCSCPGPPQIGGLHKTVKNYYLRKHKKYFLKLIMWNKKCDVSLFISFTVKCIFLYFLEI